MILAWVGRGEGWQPETRGERCSTGQPVIGGVPGRGLGSYPPCNGPPLEHRPRVGTPAAALPRTYPEVGADEGPEDVRLVLQGADHVRLLELDGGGHICLGMNGQVLRGAQAQPGQVLDRLGLCGGEEQRLALGRQVLNDGVQGRRKALAGGRGGVAG